MPILICLNENNTFAFNTCNGNMNFDSQWLKTFFVCLNNATAYCIIHKLS